jgi:hypothetical protein
MGSKSATPPSIPIPSSGRLGALLRVPVDYLFEIYENGEITSMIALPNAPQSVAQGRTSATAITHTLGEVVREITRNHRTDISLRGVSGLAPRSGQTRDGGVSLLGGRTILEEFDRFLDDYQTRASHDAERVFMVYRALNEGYAFRVEPLEFRWMEDAEQHRLSYQWELKLEAYAGAPSDPRGSIFSPVTEMVRAASQYVALAGGAVALAQNAVTNVHGELEEARELLRSIESVVRIIGETADSADGLTRFFSRDLPATWASLAQSYASARRDVDELLGLEDPSYSAELMPYYALVTAGLSGADQSDLSANADASRIETRSALSVERPRFTRDTTLRAGDTAQSVALRAYGDASRYDEIVEYNGLRDAKHHGDGRPLRAGDVLSVPFDASTGDDLGLPSKGDVFGRDLRVDADGDLVISGDDISTIEGRANLEQALRLRLLSEQGSSWILPTYGLPVQVGAPLTERVAAYCASHVTQQLDADARVDRVDNVVVSDEGDALTVSARVAPLNGASMSLIVPMGS